MRLSEAPAEKQIKLTDAKQQFSQIINHVADGESRVVIEKNGQAVAALISMGEYRRFARWDADYRERSAAMERISEAFADVPLEELEAEVDRAVASVRAKRRAERRIAS